MRSVPRSEILQIIESMAFSVITAILNNVLYQEPAVVNQAVITHYFYGFKLARLQ